MSIDDVVIPTEKDEIIGRAQKSVDEVENQYSRGFITSGERYNKVIDIWTRATTRVAERLFDSLQHSREGFNSLYMMVDSGARGSKEQVRQLAGMRGLMAKPQKSLSGATGELIENPIIANFREGLSILEYFISTHGARKGLADTALKTADAGYLTRRLVDVAQDAIITMYDCGTIRGVVTGALKEGEDVKEPLAERIIGRVTVHDVIDPLSGKSIIEAGEVIDEETADRIAETSIETVEIRSVLTCEAKRGICAPLLRSQPDDRHADPDGGGGRHNRSPVHRRAGYTADAAYLPHRRHGQSHRLPIAGAVEVRRQASV